MLAQSTELAEAQLLAAGGKQRRLPLHYAVATKNSAVVQVMVRAVGDAAFEEQLTRQDSKNMLALHLGLQSSDRAIVDTLVSTGSKRQLSVPDPSTGNCPVHCVLQGELGVVEEWHLALVTKMVQTGGVELLLTPDVHGDLPIHYAMEQRQRDVVKLLLALGGGAQCVAVDTRGESALEVALSKIAELVQMYETEQSSAETEHAEAQAELVAAHTSAMEELQVCI